MTLSFNEEWRYEGFVKACLRHPGAVFFRGVLLTSIGVSAVGAYFHEDTKRIANEIFYAQAEKQELRVENEFLESELLEANQEAQSWRATAQSLQEERNQIVEYNQPSHYNDGRYNYNGYDLSNSPESRESIDRALTRAKEREIYDYQRRINDHNRYIDNNRRYPASNARRTANDIRGIINALD